MRWTRHIAWGRGEVHTGFWWGNLRVEDHLEGLDADGKIILKWIFKKWDRDMAWIDLAQDKDKRLTLVKATINTGIP